MHCISRVILPKAHKESETFKNRKPRIVRERVISNLYLSVSYSFAIRYLSFCDPILYLSILGFQLWTVSLQEIPLFKVVQK